MHALCCQSEMTRVLAVGSRAASEPFGLLTAEEESAELVRFQRAVKGKVTGIGGD